MFKYSGLLLLAVLFQSPLSASPIQYDISFNLTFESGGPNYNFAPTEGSFLYDSSNATDPFSNFTVLWDGVTFDLTTVANTTSAMGFGCNSETTAPNYGINIMFQGCMSPCTNVTYDWVGVFNMQQGIAEFAFRADGSSNQIQIAATNSVDVQGQIDRQGTGTFTLTEVPEPAQIYPLGFGLLFFAWLGRRLAWKRMGAVDH